MGAFFTSIHVRTSDRQAAKSAAVSVVEKMKLRCLVGPELNGWIGIYPQDKSIEFEFDKEIAGLVAADVLTLIVHDDDALVYRLFRDGRLVDSYSSNPEFSNAPASQDDVGKPELFVPIIGDDVDALTALLDRENEFTFESKRLVKFTRLLGIQNAATSFHYLESGERTGIKHWKNFERIPPEPEPTGEKTPSANAIRKKLTKVGVLIYSHEWKDFSESIKGYSAGGGFVLGSVNPWQKTSSLSEFLPPDYLPRPLPPDEDRAAAVVQERFALIDCRQSTPVLDAMATPWKPIAEIQKDDRLNIAAISPDGEYIAHSHMQKVVVNRLPGGEQVCDFPLVRSGRLVFHPSGKWLAAGGDVLATISLEGEPSMRQRLVNGNWAVSIGGIRGVEKPGCIGFSRDGRYFWCGTNVCLRIAEWEAILCKPTRKSGWKIPNNDVLPSFWAKQITAIAEEVDGTGIVFATYSGKLGRFDLRTAELHRLILLPGGGQVEVLLFSADGKTLAVGSEKNTDKKPRGMRSYTRAWEIWNYEKLRASAELRGHAKLPNATE